MRSLKIASLRLALPGFAIVFGGCSAPPLYTAEHPLPGVWAYADSAVFSYEISDTSKAYDLVLGVDHTDAFPSQNLYALFATTYPNGGREVQEVSVELADRRGRWLGDCSDEECTLTLELQRGARYPGAGVYGLTLVQFGRTDSLAGLDRLRFTVAEVGR